MKKHYVLLRGGGGGGTRDWSPTHGPYLGGSGGRDPRLVPNTWSVFRGFWGGGRNPRLVPNTWSVFRGFWGGGGTRDWSPTHGPYLGGSGGEEPETGPQHMVRI